MFLGIMKYKMNHSEWYLLWENKAIDISWFKMMTIFLKNGNPFQVLQYIWDRYCFVQK